MATARAGSVISGLVLHFPLSGHPLDTPLHVDFRLSSWYFSTPSSGTHQWSRIIMVSDNNET